MGRFFASKGVKNSLKAMRPQNVYEYRRMWRVFLLSPANPGLFYRTALTISLSKV
jgi:hypothetical protein